MRINYRWLMILSAFMGLSLSFATTQSEKDLANLLSKVGRNYDFGSLRGYKIKTSLSTIQVDPGKTFRARVVTPLPCFGDSAVYLITKDSLFRKTSADAKPDSGSRPGLFDFRNQLASTMDVALLQDTVVGKTVYRRIANANFTSIWFWLGFLPPYPIQSARAIYWVDSKTFLISRITVVINHYGTTSAGLLYAIDLSGYKNYKGVQIPSTITYSLPEIDRQMTAMQIKGLVFSNSITPKSCFGFEAKYAEIRSQSNEKGIEFKSTLLSTVDLYIRILAQKVSAQKDSFPIEIQSVEKQNDVVNWSF